MKVMTIVGTRPEFVRLSRIIPLLDSLLKGNHILVNTGQNYDPGLRDVFFKELGLREPDIELGAKGTFGEQIGTISQGVERAIAEHRPDRFLVLGDTNSSMGAVAAKRSGVPVYHMEAGNRCWDIRVPEEVNRRIIDHVSDVHMPYSNRSRDYLIAEGIPANRIHVVGNPLYEVITHYSPKIEESRILWELRLTEQKYIVASFHRTENVNDFNRLENIVNALKVLAHTYEVPVIVPVHPHTNKKLHEFNLPLLEEDGIIAIKPHGMFDFLKLTNRSLITISDSGSTQEESAILGFPSVTIRDTTERPETVELGTNFVCGTNTDDIVDAVDVTLRIKVKGLHGLTPDEYGYNYTSQSVVKIVLSPLYRGKE